MASTWWPGNLLARRRADAMLRSGLERYLDLDLGEAEAQFREALATARRSGSAAAVGNAAEHLYLVLRKRRSDAESAELLKELLAAHVSRGGADSDEAFSWRNELITVLGRLGRFEEAESFCRERLDRARRRYGKDSKEAGYALVTLAWCLRRRNLWDDAERVGNDALSVLEAAAGPCAGVIGFALCGLAAVRLRRGDAAGAEESLQRALAAWSKVGEVNLAEGARAQLLDLYIATERYSEALGVSEARFKSARRHSGATGIDRERQLWNLERHAFLLQVNGRGWDAAGLDARADYLRAAIEAGARPGDGSAEDPEGPLFDCTPVLDWPAAGPTSARAC